MFRHCAQYYSENVLFHEFVESGLIYSVILNKISSLFTVVPVQGKENEAEYFNIYMLRCVAISRIDL